MEHITMPQTDSHTKKIYIQLQTLVFKVLKLNKSLINSFL